MNSKNRNSEINIKEKDKRKPSQKFLVSKWGQGDNSLRTPIKKGLDNYERR